MSRLLSTVVTALALPALAACGAPSAGSCTDTKPIFYASKCHSEASVGAAFQCPQGAPQVLREKPPPGVKDRSTMQWSVCCQTDADETHCIDFARGEGQVGEHWVCAGKKWSKTPCAKAKVSEG